MLRLYILRHAKSSWAQPGKSDFERGLNPRGLRDLAKIAHNMERKGYLPDMVYASPATRTRLTAEGICDHLERCSFEVRYRDNLYEGSSVGYLDTLRGHEDNSQSLMLVGHNPTCEYLATSLARDGDSTAMATIARKFPTGALAVLDFPHQAWSDIGEQTGYLHDFVLPRNLSTDE